MLLNFNYYVEQYTVYTLIIDVGRVWTETTKQLVENRYTTLHIVTLHHDMEQPQNTPQEGTQAAPLVQPDIVNQEKVEVINVYPTIRHLILIICALLAVAIILFLFYQNGKSIYDNGI